MDFATPEKASAMYREQKKLTGAELKLGSYDTAKVSASEVISGFCVYGHFSSIYFELTLTDYKEQPQVKKEALELVGIFKKRSDAISKK
jgi:hypothetical protein